MEILDKVPINLDMETLAKRLRLRNPNKQIEEMTQELIELARPIAKPKAIYKVAYIDSKNGDSVDIDGVRFTSRVLRVNLDKVERVFPYIATCGMELNEMTVPTSEFMKFFILDAIKEATLRMAINHLNDYVKKKYALRDISHMNPGSLSDWPLTQQKNLFSLFGNVEDLIGVRLTDSSVMRPLKSVSGIYFPTKIRFESCQLCSREKCIGRRAPYDAKIAKKYLGEKDTE